MRQLTLLLVLIFAVSEIPAQAQADLPDTDGIPANCETADSPYADSNLFPRYANGQLALIDWSSGDTVRVLEADSAASNFWLLGWSPDCHYLAGGLGDGLRYTTIIWDATSGAQIGTVEDGYRRPHFLTWSPRGDSLVVETRHGAFLWDLATGNRLQLTIDSFLGHSFIHILWNDQNGTLDTFTTRGEIVVFDVQTGRPLNIALANDQYIRTSSLYYYGLSTFVTEPNDRSPYGCGYYEERFGDGSAYFPSDQIANFDLITTEDSIVVVDEATGEVVQILAEGLVYPLRRTAYAFGYFSPDCALFFSLREIDRVRFRREGVVLRMSDGAHLHTVSHMPFPRWFLPPRQNWDSTGRYLFAQTYDGAQVWDSATDSTFYVTSADESRRYGYSVNTVTWDVANGRVTVEMLNDDEIRVFDLATGQRVG